VPLVETVLKGDLLGLMYLLLVLYANLNRLYSHYWKDSDQKYQNISSYLLRFLSEANRKFIQLVLTTPSSGKPCVYALQWVHIYVSWNTWSMHIFHGCWLDHLNKVHICQLACLECRYIIHLSACEWILHVNLSVVKASMVFEGSTVSMV